jgi:hypothetical protein
MAFSIRLISAGESSSFRIAKETLHKFCDLGLIV